MNGVDTSGEVFSQYSDKDLIDNFPQYKNLSRLREIDPVQAVKIFLVLRLHLLLYEPFLFYQKMDSNIEIFISEILC
jgi:hypothetical protein